MVVTARFVSVALMLLPLAACGGKFEAPPDGIGGDAGTSDTGGSTTDSGGEDTPATLCSTDKCGPAPGAPSELCPDGSTGGFTGRCIETAPGACGWEYRKCPPAPFSCSNSGQCGAEQYCAQEMCGGVGKCLDRPDGCATIYSPVCGCDGKTHPNSCSAASAGVSVLYNGECKPTSNYCDAKVVCPSGQFCKYPDGICSSSGAPAPSPPEPVGGTCTQKPMGCADLWNPVCGCNGKTYGNACEASSFGINVAHQGTCEMPPPPVKSCGGFVGAQCGTNEYCDWPDGTYCGGGDQMGVCRLRPMACDKILDPVCGCDGKTYSNACEAYRVGVDYLKKGGC